MRSTIEGTRTGCRGNTGRPLDYTAAIALNPNDAEAFLRGLCQESLRNIDQAIADYSKAVSLNGRMPAP